MELNLQRPLLFFDLESTGLNIATDGIIEISFVKALPGVSEPQVKTWKVKPWDYARRVQIPITPGASAVNGVKDEDLKDCPRFIEILPEVAGWLKDSDLAGFNSAKFDLPLLAEEIERARAYCEERATRPESREKALSMLNAADKAAGDDAELKRRIAMDKFNFKLDWESAAAVSASVKSSPLHRATGPIEVDGLLNEPTWKAASVSDDWRWMKTYNVDRPEPDPYRPRTKMLLQCDHDFLYIAFGCAKTPGEPEKDVPADGSHFDAMRGSHVEFVVQSPAQNGEYFHFGLSHNGKTYSALTSNPTTRDFSKKCDFKFAINDREDRWVAEIALPLKAFGPPPKEGEVWRVAAYRQASAPGGGNVDGISTGYGGVLVRQAWEPRAQPVVRGGRGRPSAPVQRQELDVPPAGRAEGLELPPERRRPRLARRRRARRPPLHTGHAHQRARGPRVHRDARFPGLPARDKDAEGVLLRAREGDDPHLLLRREGPEAGRGAA